MAKVFLSLEISVKSASSKDNINKLNSNNIPFEEYEGEIYLINKNVFDSGVYLGSREYDKPYAKFCMRLADTTDSSIYMGEGSLDEEVLAVLYEVFGDALEFQLTLSCNSDWESISASIIFNEEEDKYYCDTEVTESSEEEDEEDEEEFYYECSRCKKLYPENSECDCVNIKSNVVESTLYKEEIKKIRAVCKEIESEKIDYFEWESFFKSKGYNSKKNFNLEIIFDQVTFEISHKDNKLPLEISFIEGKFAGWIKK